MRDADRGDPGVRRCDCAACPCHVPLEPDDPRAWRPVCRDCRGGRHLASLRE